MHGGGFSKGPRRLPVTRVGDRFTFHSPYDDPSSNGPGTYNTTNMDNVTINTKYRPSAKFGNKHHPSSRHKQGKAGSRKRPYRDILKLPAGLDVKYNKLGNSGHNVYRSNSESSLRSNNNSNDSKLMSQSSSSTAYIKPITLKSRINVMKRKIKQKHRLKQKGFGSWKMDSNRLHPSKVFLQPIDPSSPGPGEYNLHTTLLHDKDEEMANKTTSHQHHIVTSDEIDHHQFVKQNQPFKSKASRFLSNESMLHGHLNLPFDYIGRVGPGSYNPKSTYNDVIYENHLVNIERQRPVWLRQSNASLKSNSNKRLHTLMLKTSNFLTPKRSDALLDFDKPKPWNMNDKRTNIEKYGHPVILKQRATIVPNALKSEQFLLHLEHEERMKELEDARRWHRTQRQQTTR